MALRQHTGSGHLDLLAALVVFAGDTYKASNNELFVGRHWVHRPLCLESSDSLANLNLIIWGLTSQLYSLVCVQQRLQPCCHQSVACCGERRPIVFFHHEWSPMSKMQNMFLYIFPVSKTENQNDDLLKRLKNYETHNKHVYHFFCSHPVASKGFIWRQLDGELLVQRRL